MCTKTQYEEFVHDCFIIKAYHFLLLPTGADQEHGRTASGATQSRQGTGRDAGELMMRALVRDASCDGTNGELRRITAGLEQFMNCLCQQKLCR